MKISPDQVVPLIAVAMNRSQRHKQMAEQFGSTRLGDVAAHRLVTLVGAGGIGKTSLARAAASAAAA